MPTYVYHCPTCDSTFEEFQRITEDPLESCPSGHEGGVRRVIQPVGIAFKGEGFHINDYGARSEAESKSTPAASESPSKPTEAATKTSEP